MFLKNSSSAFAKGCDRSWVRPPTALWGPLRWPVGVGNSDKKKTLHTIVLSSKESRQQETMKKT